METTQIVRPTETKLNGLVQTIKNRLEQGKPTYSRDRFAVFFRDGGKVKTIAWTTNLCTCGCIKEQPEDARSAACFYASSDTKLTLEEIRARLNDSIETYVFECRERLQAKQGLISFFYF